MPVAFKLTVSFNLSERTLLGQPAYVVTFKVYSLDRRPFSIKNRRLEAERNAALGCGPKTLSTMLGIQKVLC